jgi:butyryl-CoA dehydrogenase
LVTFSDRCAQKTTTSLVGQGMMGKPDVMLANAHEYLNMFGHTVIAWMWLMQVC